VRPHILPFGSSGSGTSAWTTSPPGSPSSCSVRKRKLSLEKQHVNPNTLAVKGMIDKIESEVDLEKEESCKKEESKKQEDKRKLFRKAEVKKKEDEELSIDLKVMTRMTNLQGLGPETRQGPSPASSYLDSGNLARGTRSSPVGSN
jgi:hypothetical protein